jgi:hypothetical protein
LSGVSESDKVIVNRFDSLVTGAIVRVGITGNTSRFASNEITLLKLKKRRRSNWRKKSEIFWNFGLRTLEKYSVKTNAIDQNSGWRVSFWFAVSSPLIGVLLAFLAAAIFCR